MPSPLNKKSNYLRAKTAEPSIGVRLLYRGCVLSFLSSSLLSRSFIFFLFLFFFFFLFQLFWFVAFNLLARERGDNAIT